MTSRTPDDWRERLEGLDPFDALMGRRVPSLLARHPRGRQALIQLRKRSPLDLAGLLGVEPFVMAKTAACFLMSESRRSEIGVDTSSLESLVAVLRETQGNLGAGRWGYEFDVQTRWAYYPKGSQNLIAMVFCGRAMGTAGLVSAKSEWTDELHAVAHVLVEEHLSSGDEPFFRYVKDSSRLIHNANALGAGLVAASGVLRNDADLVEVAKSAALVTLNALRVDGLWPYGAGQGVGWSDSFHTAYILDGLLLLWLATGDSQVEAAIRSGVDAWLVGFFGGDGEPWYTPTHHYPYDIHSASTAVDVGLRLASWGLCDPAIPMKAACWAECNLVDRDSGLTRAAIKRWGLDRRHFVRWGDAQWALASSSIGLHEDAGRDPFELAVSNLARSERGRI